MECLSLKLVLELVLKTTYHTTKSHKTISLTKRNKIQRGNKEINKKNKIKTQHIWSLSFVHRLRHFSNSLHFTHPLSVTTRQTAGLAKPARPLLLTYNSHYLYRTVKTSGNLLSSKSLSVQLSKPAVQTCNQSHAHTHTQFSPHTQTHRHTAAKKAFVPLSEPKNSLPSLFQIGKYPELNMVFTLIPPSPCSSSVQQWKMVIKNPACNAFHYSLAKQPGHSPCLLPLTKKKKICCQIFQPLWD